MSTDSIHLMEHEEPVEDRGSAPWWAFGCSAELGPGDLVRYRKYQRLLFLWAIVYVGAAWLLKRHLDDLGPVAYLIAAVPPVIFLFGVAAYASFLRGADELTRKIHVQALAIGFGVAMACTLGYPLLELAGAPELDLGTYALVTLAGYTFALFWTQRHYR